MQIAHCLQRFLSTRSAVFFDRCCDQCQKKLPASRLTCKIDLPQKLNLLFTCLAYPLTPWNSRFIILTIIAPVDLLASITFVEAYIHNVWNTRRFRLLGQIGWTSRTLWRWAEEANKTSKAWDADKVCVITFSPFFRRDGRKHEARCFIRPRVDRWRT